MGYILLCGFVVILVCLVSVDVLFDVCVVGFLYVLVVWFG